MAAQLYLAREESRSPERADYGFTIYRLMVTAIVGDGPDVMLYVPTRICLR